MKNTDNFRNSPLDRAKPKRHLFHSLLKRHHSDTGLVEDRTSSVTIVRIIGGLLMLHLIIIGGVLLRGHITRSNSDHSPQVGMTPPPPTQNTPVLPPPATAVAAVSPAPPAPTLPTAPAASRATTPAAPLAAPLAATAPVTPQTDTSGAAGQNHITTATQDDAAEEVNEDPAVVKASTVMPVRHRVDRGDTWQSIAQQYGVSAAALQAANPKAPTTAPTQSSTLVIPVASGDTTNSTAPHPAPQTNLNAATTAASATHSASSTAVYTVQQGETLSRIARKTKVPLKEILRLNGIKDANRIQPGMQLKLR